MEVTVGTTLMRTSPALQPEATPTAVAGGYPGTPTLHTLAAAIASGALLWACFQPLALGTYLGWFALVPFLVLVRSQERPWFIYLCAMLCGLTFFVPALQWMRVADKTMAGAGIALSIYCAFYFPAALFVTRRLERWN